MLKYYKSISQKVILLVLADLLFFSNLTHTANRKKKNTSNELDQYLSQKSYTSDENYVTSSGSLPRRKRQRSEFPDYLHLTISPAKLDLIIQKENELKNDHNHNITKFTKKIGHHWNLDEITNKEAENVCYSLWLGLKFSEIDGIDKTKLPPFLYPFCSYTKKYPIRETGVSYMVLFPHIEQLEEEMHRISVLKCCCKFTRIALRSRGSNESNRTFFAHKFKDNEYLVLAYVPEAEHIYRDLQIIDIQQIDPTRVDLEQNKRKLILTNE